MVMRVARKKLELANKVPDGEGLLSLGSNTERLKVKCFEKSLFFIVPSVLLLAVTITVTKFCACQGFVHIHMLLVS